MASTMSSLYQPTLTPSQLQAISNEEIERILQEQHVNVPKGSKEGTFQNWAKTFKCVPERVFKPKTPDQVLLITTLARRLSKPVRAAAIGHSPSDLACTSAWQILMTGFDRPISVSPSSDSDSSSKGASGGKGESSIAHVQAGMTLNALHKYLAQNGLAMTNCGSIDAQSLGGTIVTCTHGSGWDFGVLTETVREVGVVVAGGDSQGQGQGVGEVRLVRCSKDVEPDLFNATICGLGLTGIITDIKIAVEPAFRLREKKTPITLDQLLSLPSSPSSPSSSLSRSPSSGSTTDQTPLLPTQTLIQKLDLQHVNAQDHGQGIIDRIAQSAEHVRLWYYPHTDGVVVAQAGRVYEDPIPTNKLSDLWGEFTNFHMTQFFLFLAKFAPRLTTWVGKWAWWLQSDGGVGQDHGFKVFTFDCLFPQYTTEWAIPYTETRQTLIEIRDWLKREQADPNGERVHWPIEIRFSKPDDVWLSPGYGRRTTWIGIVQYRAYGLSTPYEKIFERFTSILKAHQGRPHWAKQHDFTRGTLNAVYPMFDRFCRVREKWDPENRWACTYGERHFGTGAGEGEGEKIKEVPK